MPETDRVELIAAMEMVDYVVVYDEPDPYNLIAAIKPNVLAKGGDWSPDKIIGADIVERHGGRVAVIPYLEGFSTTEIIERIRSLIWREFVKFAVRADPSAITSVTRTTKANVLGGQTCSAFAPSLTAKSNARWFAPTAFTRAACKKSPSHPAR